jgi:hypothetical protein
MRDAQGTYFNRCTQAARAGRRLRGNHHAELARQLPLSVVILISDRGNIMKASRLVIAGSVAALLHVGAAVAQSPTTPPADQPTQPAQQGATFESLDTDSDGRISKTEAASNQAVTEQFSRYDKNGNGFIEREEVTSSQSAPSQEPQQPQQ